MTEIRKLMKFETAGDPMTGTKWTRTTPQKIAEILNSRGFRICRNTVVRILLKLKFSLKANRKSIATSSSPDRDKQFGIIRCLRDTFEAAGDPIISVDTKKKELVGLFSNRGRVWTRAPIATLDHDFRSDASALAVPYGIFDVVDNSGVVVVGTSSETPRFAVHSIVTWWRYRGRYQYPGSHKLLILADCGGANGYRPRAWKYELQYRLADRHDLTVTVAHYPSGASKWNPVEHRLFSEISKNWAGRPLDSLETVLKYIETTTTRSGLQVRSYLDSLEYAKGQKISDSEMDQLSLVKGEKLESWNYTVSPSFVA